MDDPPHRRGRSQGNAYDIDVPNDGKYYTYRINLQEQAQPILSAWEQGKNGYIFAAIGTTLGSGAALYTADIHYEPTIPALKLTAAAEGITTTGATIKLEYTLPEGYSNFTATVDGVAVEGNAILLTGLTPNTTYTKWVIYGADYNGQHYTMNPMKVTIRTEREAGNDPVYYGHIENTGKQGDKTFDFTIDYSITWNIDKTLTIDAVFGGMDVEGGFGKKVNLQVAGDDWQLMTDAGDDHWTYTSVNKFEAGTLVNMFFWLEYPNGVVGGEDHILYTVGESNEKPAALPTLKTSVENITANSADIVYTATAPADMEGAAVKVYMDGKEVAGSPIALTGLAEAIDYTHTMYATATLGDVTRQTKEITLSFRTLRATAVDLTYNGYGNVKAPNAYLIGEDAQASRRTFYAGVPYSVTLTAAGGIEVVADFSTLSQIVGIVPQVCVGGTWQNLVDGKASFAGPYTEDQALEVFFYAPYDGNAARFDVSGYKAGQVSDPVALGEAAALNLSMPSTCVAMGVSQFVEAYVTDAQSHYLNGQDIEYTVPAGVAYEGGKLTVNEKGVYSLVGKVGNAEGILNFVCALSASARNLHSESATFTSDGENAANAFDGNEGSEVFWNCAETEEHNLVYVLDKSYDIEAIDLVWEGASATHYTVTISNETPASSAYYARVLP